MNGQVQVDVKAVEEAREKLIQAIEEGMPLVAVQNRYVDLMVARYGTKVLAAEKLGVNRRTVQRWGKAGEERSRRARRDA